MLNFELASVDEIALELGKRLKAARLQRNLTQFEVAERAGVSGGTVKGLELTGQSTMHSLIRVAQALGMEGQLDGLFKQTIVSIADMERLDQHAQRQRASSRKTAA